MKILTKNNLEKERKNEIQLKTSWGMWTPSKLFSAALFQTYLSQSLRICLVDFPDAQKPEIPEFVEAVKAVGREWISGWAEEKYVDHVYENLEDISEALYGKYTPVIINGDRFPPQTDQPFQHLFSLIQLVGTNFSEAVELASKCLSGWKELKQKEILGTINSRIEPHMIFIKEWGGHVLEQNMWEYPFVVCPDNGRTYLTSIMEFEEDSLTVKPIQRTFDPYGRQTLVFTGIYDTQDKVKSLFKNEVWEGWYE